MGVVWYKVGVVVNFSVRFVHNWIFSPSNLKYLPTPMIMLGRKRRREGRSLLWTGRDCLACHSTVWTSINSGHFGLWTVVKVHWLKRSKTSYIYSNLYLKYCTSSTFPSLGSVIIVLANYFVNDIHSTINPRRMRHRVTVVVLCVCLSVTTKSAAYLVFTLQIEVL